MWAALRSRCSMLGIRPEEAQRKFQDNAVKLDDKGDSLSPAG